MATAAASSRVQCHNYQLSSVSTRSTSHLLGNFSQSLAYSQFHRSSTTLASWPLKQSIDAPKHTKTKTESQPLKKEKPHPTPKRKPDVSKLFDRSCNIAEVPGITTTLYSNGETWLPPAPEVSRPRAIYNAASLAYLGDCIYELYARRHFLFPPLSINEYNNSVMALVCCEAQDTLLKELLKDGFLSEEERDVIRWGRNIQSGKTRTTRRAGAAVYNRASSLETLVGYLYLTNANRLDTVMRKLGFCTHHIGSVSFKGLN